MRIRTVKIEDGEVEDLENAFKDSLTNITVTKNSCQLIVKSQLANKTLILPKIKQSSALGDLGSLYGEMLHLTDKIHSLFSSIGCNALRVRLIEDFVLWKCKPSVC